MLNKGLQIFNNNSTLVVVQYFICTCKDIQLFPSAFTFTAGCFALPPRIFQLISAARYFPCSVCASAPKVR